MGEAVGRAIARIIHGGIEARRASEVRETLPRLRVGLRWAVNNPGYRPFPVSTGAGGFVRLVEGQPLGHVLFRYRRRQAHGLFLPANGLVEIAGLGIAAASVSRIA